ncbi:MAG: metallophosphoesterase family protein [Chloroflexi bacterium]|nr:metallophosphoesterase family protein [Chloroflexota bacterium]
MRIGVLADTHVPDRLSALPLGVGRALGKPDIVLHVGDATQMDVLRWLRESWPLTFGVFGDQDNAEVRRCLQARQVVQFGSRRVGLIHGHVAPAPHWPARLSQALQKPPVEELLDRLLEQFTDQPVDCIVFGHTHRPLVRYYRGVLFFNPGAASGGRQQPVSVGTLEITDRSITAQIIEL